MSEEQEREADQKRRGARFAVSPSEHVVFDASASERETGSRGKKTQRVPRSHYPACKGITFVARRGKTQVFVLLSLLVIIFAAFPLLRNSTTMKQWSDSARPWAVRDQLSRGFVVTC